MMTGIYKHLQMYKVISRMAGSRRNDRATRDKEGYFFFWGERMI